MGEFLQNLETARERLGIPREWLNRSINVGFSGGERKRLMLLRLNLTNPRLAILDEPDSGADTETQKLIANTINQMPDTTFLFISHQDAFTKMVHPTHTTTLSNGKIMIK
jgi:Fe-S cluster assembly ATP-binding protein